MENEINITFDFEKNEIKTKSPREECLINIIKKICSKENKDINDYEFFYKEEKIIIDEKIKIEDLDKENEEIKIKAISKNEALKKTKKENFINNNVICPKCKRYIIINIEDYKITLSKCDKGHFFPNILLDKFYSTQKLDIKLPPKEDIKPNPNILSQESAPTPASSKSLSNILKEEKTDYSYYYNSKCLLHHEKYSSYCLDCNKNLCSECEMNHNINRDNKFNHKIIHFYEILSNNDEYVNKLKIDMKKLRLKIDILKVELNKLLHIINSVINNYEVFYNIYNNIVSNYKIETRNYHILKNITNIRLDEAFQDIDTINEEGHYFKKFEKVFDVYNKMNCQNEILIKYLPEKAKKIRLFGAKFVANNKSKCKLLFNNQLLDIYESYIINDDLKKYINSKNGILEIKLKINKKEKLTNISHMFKDCSTLLFLPNISELNTFHVTDMSYLFYGCTLLGNLPNISKWNTSNVTNMSYMFFNCTSLASLPDISNWDISNCTDLSHLFSNCVSLESISDISRWNINNVTNLSYLFYYCQSLKSLPNIDKWDIKKVNNISYMFSCCTSLTKIPDISVWNTSQLKDVSYLFFGCRSLTSLPDISKWDTHNVINMGFMFDDLNPNLKIPKINPNECHIF